MVRQLTFEQIKKIWESDLWSDKSKIEVLKDGVFQPQEIKPMSCMVFNNLNRLDENIFNIYDPLFLGYDNDGIKAVNSGHRTSVLHYRTRGALCDLDSRRKGYSDALMQSLEEDAVDLGCELIWTFSKTSSIPFYESCGFEKTGQGNKTNWYMYKYL